MKNRFKIIISILLKLVFSSVLFCQQSFPTSNATWCYQGYGDTGEDLGNYCISPIDSVEFDNKVYTRIDYWSHPYANKQELLYREEDRKFYVVPPDSVHEMLVYDFNLNVGDTFETNWSWGTTDTVRMVVMSIDTVTTLDGLSRKRMNLANKNYPGTGQYHSGTWLEGIGSLDWMFVYPSYVSSVSGGFGFACHWTNGNLIYPYESTSGNCYIIDNIPEENLDSNISFYPNPMRDKLNIEFSGTNFASLKVLDLYGNIVYKNTQHHTALELSHLKSGVYFVIIGFKNGNYMTKKIIKI